MRLTFPNAILVWLGGDPNKEEQAMVIHFVRFKTRLAQEEVRRIMEERAPRFRSEALGLVQKITATSRRAGPFAAATSSTQKSLAKRSLRAS